MAGTPVQPTLLNTHVSEPFGKLLEVGLRKIFFDYLKEIPEQYPKVYNIHKSNKAKETDWGMGAFTDWVQRDGELDTVAYEQLSPGLERIYTHNAFTKGFMIGRELYDDEQYRQIAKFPHAMARAGRAKVEKDAMGPLNDGFTVNGYDGVPLFSDSHPLLDSDALGKNLATGALTDANLEAAIMKMRETVDEAGNLVFLRPTKLIVPPKLENTAKVILNTTGKPGGDLNDINVMKGALNLVVLEYLGAAGGGSDTHWFIQADTHELNFFWRIKPEFKWDEDFDTFVAKYRGYMRYSYGYSDWRGLVGSTGV